MAGFRLNLGLLSNMEQVLFADNSFSGRVPSEIAQWTLVRMIDLYGNKLTGPIPEIRLELLESLDVSGNRLNSKIPRELASARNPTVLNFNDTDLGPSLPLELFTLENL